jgi:hypothetical protein
MDNMLGLFATARGCFNQFVAAKSRKPKTTMETLPTFNIQFTRRGETQTRVRQFQAVNPGSAFAKCVSKFPDCKLLGGRREGKLGGGDFSISYAPPSTIRIVVAEPEPEGEQLFFGFFEHISFNRKEQHQGATTSMPLTNSSHIAAETAGEKAVLRKRARRRHEITGTFPAVLPHTNGE